MVDNQVIGPSMFSATTVMKTPPTRVGKITKDISLPRTVELKNLIAGGAGALLGLGIAAIAAGGSLRSLLLGAAIFGAMGVAIVTYSPLKGESLSTWIGLTIKARKNQVSIKPGLVGKAYIGIAPLTSVSANEGIRIISGAVEVPLGSFDERGVLVERSSSKSGKSGVKFPSPTHDALRAVDRSNAISWKSNVIPSTPSFDLRPRSR